METGLVNIEFTGIATAYFATSAKVRADMLELKKMGSEIGLGGIGGGVGGAGSVESQLAPVRAASTARRQIYKEEADAHVLREQEAIATIDGFTNRELLKRKELLTTGKADYDEYLNYLKANTLKANAEMAASNKATMEAATLANVEASRISRGYEPTPGISGVPGMYGYMPPPRLPNVPRGTGNAAEDIESDIRGTERRKLSPFFTARAAQRGLGAADLESGVGSSLGTLGDAGMYGGFGMISDPYVAVPAIGLGAGAIVAGESMKQGGAYESGMALSGAQVGLSPDEFEKLYGGASMQLSEGKYAQKGLKAEDIGNQITRLIESFGGTDRAKETTTFIPMISTALQLAKGTGETLEQAVDQMRVMLNEIGLKFTGPNAISGPDLVKKFDEMANIVAAGGQQGQLRGPGLGQAFPKVGSLGSEAGMSPEQIVAALEVVSRAFPISQPAQVGTATRQILLGTEELAGNQKKLDKYGLNAEDLDIKDKGFGNVVKTITNMIASLPTDAERNAASMDIFKARWTNTFDVLKKNMHEWYELSKKIEGTGAVKQMADAQSDTLATKEAQVAAQFRNLFIDIFKDDKGDFKRLVDDVGRLLADVRKNEPMLLGAVDALIKLIDHIVNAAGFLISTPGAVKKTVSKIGQGSGIAVDEEGNPIYKTGTTPQNAPVPFSANEGQIINAAQQYAKAATGANAKSVQDTIESQIKQIRDDNQKALNATSSDEATKYYEDVAKRLEYLKKFGSGGYTGDMPDDQPAGFVHGGEVVIDAPTVRRAGLGNVLAYYHSLRGYDGGGLVDDIFGYAHSGMGALNGFMPDGLPPTGNRVPYGKSVAGSAAVGAPGLGGDPRNSFLAKALGIKSVSGVRGMERTFGEIGSTIGTLASATTPAGAMALLNNHMTDSQTPYSQRPFAESAGSLTYAGLQAGMGSYPNTPQDGSFSSGGSQALLLELQSMGRNMKQQQYVTTLDQNKQDLSASQYQTTEGRRSN
jgi:hypothetical protein